MRPEPIRPHLFRYRAQDPYPLGRQALRSRHLARLPCTTCAFSSSRARFARSSASARQKYIMVESYRNELEQFNLQCWALTAESFFDTAEWIWLYQHFGYTGDYEFIYFE